MLILSHHQTQTLLNARASGVGSVIISSDLRLSQTEVNLTPEGVQFSDGTFLSWGETESIDEHPQTCFKVSEEGVEKIQVFSDAFNRLYSLMPTSGAPTMLISGIPMPNIICSLRYEGKNPVLRVYKRTYLLSSPKRVK